MVNYLSPGIYIEEVPAGAMPIEAVGTSTAGFIGVAPDRSAYAHKAEAVNNWTEFLKKYASSTGTGPGTHLAQAVFGFFLNGGRRC
jgi:phage tail sheath protein FI